MNLTLVRKYNKLLRKTDGILLHNPLLTLGLALPLAQRIDPGVLDLTVGGGVIVGPVLLDMDQGALARAIEPVLQGRQRDEVGFIDTRFRRRLHGQINCWTVTPSGRPASSTVTA